MKGNWMENVWIEKNSFYQIFLMKSLYGQSFVNWHLWVSYLSQPSVLTASRGFSMVISIGK